MDIRKYPRNFPALLNNIRCGYWKGRPNFFYRYEIEPINLSVARFFRVADFCSDTKNGTKSVFLCSVQIMAILIKLSFLKSNFKSCCYF